MTVSRFIRSLHLAALGLAATFLGDVDSARGQGRRELSEPEQQVVAEFRKRGGKEIDPFSRPADRLVIEFADGVTDADLKALRETIRTSPRSIDLRLEKALELTDEGLAELRELDTLVGLTLVGNKFTDAGLQHLAGLKNLEQLRISSTALTEAGLAPIGKLTKLRSLSIDPKTYEVKPGFDQRFGAKAYSHLANLENLEDFYFRHSVADDELRYMTKWKKLKELRVEHRAPYDRTDPSFGDLTDAGLAHLGKLTGLRELSVKGSNLTAAGLANLAKLTNVEKLTIVDCEAFRGKALAALAPLKQLTKLELIDCGPLDAVASRHLGKLPSLIHLQLDEVEQGGLVGLAAAPKLEVLWFHPTPIADADLAPIGRIKSLKKLTIQQCRITDAGVKHLAGLKNLVELSLSENEITDVALASVGKMEMLQQLGLTKCKITGSGFKHLAKLKQLNTIWLGDSLTTDEYLSDLSALSELKGLFMPGTKTTEAGAIKLKQKFPKAYITDFSGSEVKLTEKPSVAVMPAAADLSKIAPEHTHTAEEYFAAYKADAAAANQKFKGRAIELTGEVFNVGLRSRQPMIFLKAGPLYQSIGCVTVDAEPWARITAGQKIRIRGKALDSSQPTLLDCAVIDFGTYTAVQATAQDLATENGADPAAFEKKYEKKRAAVTGVVAEKKYVGNGPVVVTLVTAGDVKFFCEFDSDEYSEVTKRLEVGKPARIVGGFFAGFKADEVRLSSCKPVFGEKPAAAESR